MRKFDIPRSGIDEIKIRCFPLFMQREEDLMRSRDEGFLPLAD